MSSQTRGRLALAITTILSNRGCSGAADDGYQLGRLGGRLEFGSRLLGEPGWPALHDLGSIIDELRAYRPQWLGLPLRVVLYEGTSVRPLSVMEIGLDGEGGASAAVVVTVTAARQVAGG